MPFSAVWSESTLLAILSKQYYQGLHCFTFSAVWSRSIHYFLFSAVWSVSTLFAILNILIRVYTVCIFSILIRVYTICHSQQSDQFLQYLPLSVLSGSTLFSGERGGLVVECRTPEQEVRGSRPTAAVLCPWARHFTPRKYWLITQEAMAPSRYDWKIVDWDVKPQHNQPTLFSLLSSLTKVCTVILNSLIRFYTICHSQQSDQGQGPLSFSGTVWTMSTLFAILSSLIRVYTVCHSLQSDQGLHYLPFSATDHGIHYFPFFLSSIIMIYTVCHSFLAVLSRSTLFSIFSCLISVLTISHSQQSDQGLHCFPFSAVWSRSTLFAIHSLIRVYIICHSEHSVQSLHYLPFSAVWSRSTLFAILRSLIRVYTICYFS